MKMNVSVKDRPTVDEVMAKFPVTYTPNFITDPDVVFSGLWEDLNWEHRHGAPRREYWTNVFNRPYTYGKNEGVRTYASHITHPAIEFVSDKLEALLGFRYEGCFLNGYRDASDALGPHADDDPAIDHSRPIAVVTVGGGRDIECIDMVTKEKARVFLEPGSLFLMHAGMQSTHLHRIPKAGFVVSKPRISLTYRGLFA
jgi:alkylated DNA repair dioxygenase AlkB